MKEDQENIKKLCSKKKKRVNFEKFKASDYIIKAGFYNKGTPTSDEAFFSAHWYMSMVTSQMLSNGIIALSPALVQYYQIYKNPNTSTIDKRINFNYFVRTCQGFVIFIDQHNTY